MPKKKVARKAPARKTVKKKKKKKAAPAGAGTAGIRLSGLTAADLMARDVLTVHPGTPVSEVSALFKLHNIKGAPVVEGDGDLVGIITEDDLVFGQLGISDEEREMMSGPDPRSRRQVKVVRRVAEIMTHNPIAVEETAPVEDLCRLMSRLKIHRIPIVNAGKVVGIVSTIDICRLLGDGHARLVRS